MFQRGQAFDVFKLLIAAVVAIALLAVLLPIIYNIIMIGQNKPTETAVSLVKDSYNKPSLYQSTDNVTFNESDSLNAKTIASSSRILTEDQVCVSAGELSGDPNFSDGANGIVQYSGKSAKTVKLGIVCDIGKDVLNDFSQYGLDPSLIPSSCSACTSGNQTCCVILIQKR